MPIDLQQAIQSVLFAKRDYKMKKFFTSIIFALVAITSTAVMAGRTDEGTWAVGADFMFDSATVAGPYANLEFELGKFTKTNELWGGTLELTADDYVTTVAAGPKYEYYFDLDTPYIPYIGAGIQLAYSSYDLGESNSEFAIVGELNLGMKFFLTENTAIDMSINAAAASGDIYSDEDGMTSNNIDFTIGFDFCF